ncbi:CGNR zinc finger domain-containing protein [Nocardioides marmoriginsengisoli]|uniref:CGNR zinc finger domain-containing protein n=1 Tax=Nocardioides marmoriginsengisoli TaxID=661483 RepID=A0A3N0CIZ4_9ACTN|nr:CGNR zinc finger domain-containing protein [Nocardioides marmoriginsengisoli]RNL63241.1 CGNR zinc finger domain-containing protein [Nocardioides marmoriginsengisoli]
MVFAHDTETALLAAVELANSELEPDTLTRVADLDAFYERHQYTGAHERTTAELDAVRALRGDLRALLTCTRDEAVATVNTMLTEAQAVPQLIRHGDLDWHIHAVAISEPLDVRIVVETAMAMVDVIRADEMSRLAVCADEDCDGVVLDLSRNRSRKFCSTTCGNRNAVAAYRARQSG